MPLIDEATLIVGSGNYFTGAVSAALPSDLRAPGAAWTNIGHTSIEDILASETEGGEVTMKGTLQNPSLRTTRTIITEKFTVNLQQFDRAALKLFYGSNAKMDATGKMLQIPRVPVPTECAFMGVFLDGSEEFAIYIPRCEILRGDNMELANTEDFATLPLAITPLGVSGQDWNVAVTPMGEPTP